MTDKLEQGMANIIKKGLGLKQIRREIVLDVLRYLDSKGIVRKVEGQFPPFQSRFTERHNAELLARGGWSKTERIIQGE